MVINFNKTLCNRKYIKKINEAYDYTIEYLKIPCKELEININFVSEKEIKVLNTKFRNKDAVTDVLSFPNLLEVGRENMQLIIEKLTKDNYKQEINFETNSIFVGDICICKSVAYKHAKEYGNTKIREIVYMAVHGLLHLLGYDHIVGDDKKIMRQVEEEIMSHINLRRD